MNLWPWLIFVTVLGGCIGSFLNVVIYRLPEGLSIVSPPSSCPKCGHRLAWHDNVPVLGWVWLYGRCRYCENPISVQYPIIEAATAVLFGGWFYVCYMSGLRPDFAGPGLEATWLIFAVYAVLLASLLASTMIDAKFYIIPLEIPWLATAAAVVLLPLAVGLYPQARQVVEVPWAVEAVGGVGMVGASQEEVTAARLSAVRGPYDRAAAARVAAQWGLPGPVEVSAAPLVSQRATMMAIGGVIGLAAAIGLLWLGVLPRSFEDPLHDQPKDEDVPPLPPTSEPEPELDLDAPPDAPPDSESAPTPEADSVPEVASSPQTVVAPTAMEEPPPEALDAPGVPGVPESSESPDTATADDPHEWLAHPHPRREIFKECLFLALPIIGAVIGYMLADGGTGGGVVFRVLGGVLMGYLAGGAVVWGVRVLGTLGFGKEAMGLGDVHLMAAVGAVCGWQVAVLAFFVAPFFGLTWALVSAGTAKLLRREVKIIPYGPHLAVASVLVMTLREPLVAYFGLLMGG